MSPAPVKPFTPRALLKTAKMLLLPRSPAPVKPFTPRALLKTAKMLLLPRLDAQTEEPWGASIGVVSNRNTGEGRENFVEVKFAPANRRSAMLAELGISTISDYRIVTKYVGVFVVHGKLQLGAEIRTENPAIVRRWVHNLLL